MFLWICHLLGYAPATCACLVHLLGCAPAQVMPRTSICCSVPQHTCSDRYFEMHPAAVLLRWVLLRSTSNIAMTRLVVASSTTLASKLGLSNFLWIRINNVRQPNKRLGFGTRLVHAFPSPGYVLFVVTRSMDRTPMGNAFGRCRFFGDIITRDRIFALLPHFLESLWVPCLIPGNKTKKYKK